MTPTSPLILVLGSTGQVGRALQEYVASPFAPNRLKTAKILWASRRDIDLLHPSRVYDFITQMKPNLIINAAAYTQVDRAEDEAEAAMAVNAFSVGEIAHAAADLRSWLIHYSTNYVFDGQKPEPYKEDDAARPLSMYGKSKAAGEETIRTIAPRHFTLRLSSIYADHGSNFFITMQRLMREREEVRVVADQVQNPTSSHFVAKHTWSLVEHFWQLTDPNDLLSRQCGTYHLTTSGSCSWHEFAKEIFTQAVSHREHRCRNIIPISTREWPTKAVRPLNGVLSCAKYSQLMGQRLDDWQTDFRALLASAKRL